MTDDLTAPDVESLLWDCVNTPDEDAVYEGRQTAGVSRLAELIAGQGLRIATLEARIAVLEGDGS